MIEWKLTTFFCIRTHGWTRHHALVGSPVSMMRAERQATPQLLTQKMWSIPTTLCKILRPNGQPSHQILIALCSFNGCISSQIRVKTIDWKSGCPRWFLVVHRNQAFGFIGPGGTKWRPSCLGLNTVQFHPFVIYFVLCLYGACIVNTGSQQ